MITKFEEVKIVARKRVVWLVVEIVLVIGLLSLSGCGAAWISYSKGDQAQRNAKKIELLQYQINDTTLKVETAEAVIKVKDRQIEDLIIEKKDLIAEKNNLFDQLKKKGYKITITSNGGYEIDDTDVKTSEIELESQAQETISELNKVGKEARESADRLEKEFGDKKSDKKDKPEKKAGK